MVRHIVDGKIVLEYEKPQIGGGSANNFDPAAKETEEYSHRWLHLAPVGEPPDRVPQSGAAQTEPVTPGKRLPVARVGEMQR